MKVFTQLDAPAPQSEKLDTQDIAILDKTSLTSVVDFMLKFQEDATFTPPTKEVLFESDKYDLDIDSDDELPNQFSELEDLDEVLNTKDK